MFVFRPSVHGQSNNNNIPIFEIYGIKNPHNFNPAPPMRGEPILDFIIFKPQKPNNTNNVYPNNPFFGASTMSPSNGQNIQGKVFLQFSAEPFVSVQSKPCPNADFREASTDTSNTLCILHTLS